MNKKRKSLLMFGMTAAVVTVGLFGDIFKDNQTGLVKAETVTDDSATVEFITLIGERARQIGQERGIYASVLIAQAILESNSGQSTLSLPPHYNLFGIKGQYNGNSVTMKTWEDDGNGNPYTIDAAFRVYPSWAASMYDYANLLGTNLYANARKANAATYQDATAALTGLYATDTSYATKLNSIITHYNLTAYDVPQETTIWNPYRGAYTDAQTLEADEAWTRYLQSGAY